MLQSLHVVNANSYSYAGRFTCMPQVGLGWSGPSSLTYGIIIGPRKTCIVGDQSNCLGDVIPMSMTICVLLQK